MKTTKAYIKQFTYAILLLIAAHTTVIGQQGQAVIYDQYAGTLNPQDFSKLPPMDRDIAILKNILSELFEQDNRFISFNKNFQGMYVPGNGVIFTATYKYRTRNLGFVYEISTDGKVVSKNGDDADEDAPETVEEANQQLRERLQEMSELFLSNYGSLLTELKSGEKVMLSVEFDEQLVPDKIEKTKSSRDRYIFGRGSTVEGKVMVSEISHSDLQAYSNGSLSDNQVKSKINTRIDSRDKKEMVDAKILAGIFDDLFKRSFDGLMSRSGSTTWSYFEGFGLMYNINLSNRNATQVLILDDNGSVDRQTLSKDDVTKKLEEDYEGFEDMVKENVLKYGRTLRNLKSNEVLILNINLNSYYSRRSEDKPKIPRSIQVMVSKSSIEAYAKGSKSLNQAKQDVNIRKMSASLNNTMQLLNLQPSSSQGIAPARRSSSSGRSRGRTN